MVSRDRLELSIAEYGSAALAARRTRDSAPRRGPWRQVIVFQSADGSLVGVRGLAVVLRTGDVRPVSVARV